MSQWFHPRGELARDGWESVVDARALDTMQHAGLRIAELADGEPRSLDAGDVERLVIPLAGSFHVDYTLDGKSAAVDLVGRASVFDGPPDVVYLPAGTALDLSGRGRVAVAESPASTPHPVVYLPKAKIPVELRGAGRASRQIHNYGTPAILEASKFIVCEVITPAGNWSSYPAHKHDTHIPGIESRLEEIYYFEMAVARGTRAPATADPFGMFTAYPSKAGQITIDAIVRSGDIALIPYGFHGPAAAPPDYDMYYLNVMAGPDAERIWRFADDPVHAWVREGWKHETLDSRLPYRATEEG